MKDIQDYRNDAKRLIETIRMDLDTLDVDSREANKPIMTSMTEPSLSKNCKIMEVIAGNLRALGQIIAHILRGEYEYPPKPDTE